MTPPMTPSAEVMPVVKYARDREATCNQCHANQPCRDEDCVVARAYLALLQRAEKAEAILRALVDHCDGMESQHEDYHRMAEQGIPCRSAPLNDAIAYLDGAS